MLRTVGRIALLIAIVLALIWIGQAVELFAIFAHPEAGAIGFGVFGATCVLVARRAADKAKD